MGTGNACVVPVPRLFPLFWRRVGGGAKCLNRDFIKIFLESTSFPRRRESLLKKNGRDFRLRGNDKLRNPVHLIKTLCINGVHPPAPFKGGMGQSGNLPKSPFEGGQGGCYNPANLKNLMKIKVQTEKAPLNPPEGGKLPSFGGVRGGLR